MDLEIIMLSDIVRERQIIIWFHFYVKSKNQDKQNRNKVIQRTNKLVAARGERGGEWTK